MLQYTDKLKSFVKFMDTFKLESYDNKYNEIK